MKHAQSFKKDALHTVTFGDHRHLSLLPEKQVSIPSVEVSQL